MDSNSCQVKTTFRLTVIQNLNANFDSSLYEWVEPRDKPYIDQVYFILEIFKIPASALELQWRAPLTKPKRFIISDYWKDEGTLELWCDDLVLILEISLTKTKPLLFTVVLFFQI